jgi:hypothetical protein
MPPAPQITIDSDESTRVLTPRGASISLPRQPRVEVVSDWAEQRESKIASGSLGEQLLEHRTLLKE